MPKYGGNLSKRDKGYKRINEDCSFYLSTYVLGVTLTDKNIKHLVNRKPIHPYDMQRKDGTSFRTIFIRDSKNSKLFFA